MNWKVTALFQGGLVSVSTATFYRSNFVSNINWKKVWSLTQQFLLINKVKEVLFNMIQILSSQTLFKKWYRYKMRLLQISSWNMLSFILELWSTRELWHEINNFIAACILPNFVLYYKNVVFGCYDHSSNDDFLLV